MNQPTKKLPIVFLFAGALLILSFFIPWVKWEGSTVAGYQLPAGSFFGLAESKYKLGNPFPQLDFTFLLFWLVPVLAAIALLLTLLKKKAGLWAGIAATLSLAAVVIFVLFSNVLVTLGVGENLQSLLVHGIYIQAAAAVIFLFAASLSFGNKILWLLIGPVFAVAGFMLVKNHLETQTFDSTANLKPDYTLQSDVLISEFLTGDSAANKKYMDKIILVDGKASSVNILPDSTAVIQFADSTGSYAVFSLEKTEYETVKNIKPGDAVAVKGVCSGSIFSEILQTTSVNFKRSTLINKN